MAEAEVDDAYATRERLAIHLEAGWSDFLFTPSEEKASATLPYPNPLKDNVPPDFPRAVAGLAKQWAAEIGLDARRFSDFGGATGRTLYEVDLLFPRLTSLVLVEPSKAFCEWAERLLATDVKLTDIPVVDVPGTLRAIEARGRPSPISNAKARLKIRNETLEHHTSRDGYDLVTCLNVVDRHPRPFEVVAHLERNMNEGGLLLMSCPFDFHEESTPDPADWISDLNALFDKSRSWEHIGEDQLYYEYRGHKRSWTRLIAQVVGKRWIN